MQRPMRVIIKTHEQIEGIRRSCQLARDTLDMIKQRIRPGITTNDLNRWAHDYILDHGAYPAPLNYHGFPKSVCTSVNEVICHGIPNDDPLREGDIVNVDVTCILNGYYGDCNRMYAVGEISEKARRLIRVTAECLYAGINQVRPGNSLGDVGHAIQRHAERSGYSVVRDFCGHGVGVEFHEDPEVPHFGKRRTGLVLRPNMVFTIEPMINLGKRDSKTLSDGWTAVTADGSLSAQWEHTVRVTESGVEIMTE